MSESSSISSSPGLDLGSRLPDDALVVGAAAAKLQAAADDSYSSSFSLSLSTSSDEEGAPPALHPKAKAKGDEGEVVSPPSYEAAARLPSLPASTSGSFRVAPPSSIGSTNTDASAGIGGSGFKVAKQDTMFSIYDTLEPAPQLSLYSKDGDVRPSLRELINEESGLVSEGSLEDDGTLTKPEEPEGGKFGTWNGVFVPCLLNIWGVIMFLRMGWVVGQAGILLATLIVLLATTVTVISTLSLSAICTNGVVGSGGAYFLISRNLGPAVGGSIGILFSLANCVAVALYVVGFAETVVALFNEPLISEGLDLRLLGIVTLVVLFCMVMIGVGWIVKLQLVLLAVLLIAMASILIGLFAGGSYADPSVDSYVIPDESASGASESASNETLWTGFVGVGKGMLGENMLPHFDEKENFFSVFAVFFPAATGIMAGANISGDLKDPSVNIPKGTLVAIALSSTVYVVLCFLSGSVVVTDALKNNLQIYQNISVWAPLVLCGIFAATLSSALASLVGGPKVFQAVCQDAVIPAIVPLGKGRARDGEPTKAYFLAFFIAAGCILIGELNVIASLISQLFLIAYAFINYACFAATVFDSPGWRPTFKYYHWSSAAVGGLLCVVVMFLADYITALIAFVVLAGLYQAIVYIDPQVNWGSAMQSKSYLDALRKNLSLLTVKEHEKTWRPSILLLCGEPAQRPHLGQFCNELTRDKGLMMLGSIFQGKLTTNNVMEYREMDLDGEVRNLGLEGFSDVTIAEDLRTGAQQLMLLSGIGHFRPNTVMVGYKHSWRASTVEENEEYVSIIRDILDMKMCCIVAQGLHYLSFDDPRRETRPIDIYWMGDDGGFNVLIPYILSTRKKWSKAPLRLFTRRLQRNSVDEQEHLRIQNLMAKFRIPVSHIEVLSDLEAMPSKQATKAYEAFRLPAVPNKYKTHYVHLGEIVRDRSADSSIVFMSLAIPKQGVDPRVYMSWMETLLFDAEKKIPIIFLRGNNQNVLTFNA